MKGTREQQYVFDYVKITSDGFEVAEPVRFQDIGLAPVVKSLCTPMSIRSQKRHNASRSAITNVGGHTIKRPRINVRQRLRYLLARLSIILVSLVGSSV